MNFERVAYFCIYAFGGLTFFARGNLLRGLFPRGNLKRKFTDALTIFAVQGIAFSIIFLFTRSINVSLPISIILSYIPKIYKSGKERKEAESRRKSWPLVIDQLSTATASGVPIHIALTEMASRGPTSLHFEFNTFKNSFAESGSLVVALQAFVHSAALRGSTTHSRMAAQLRTTLLIARDCGGQEIGPILRNLSMHLRQRERAFDEIAVRQNWIKNGAALAALTPWLLLLVLSLHSQTIEAYSSSSGRAVLILGLLITIFAYKWITNISNSVSSENRSN